jgi:Tfp pilus assembly protein PilV
MRQTSFRARAAGISLIEALVALAVMAFGMLGVVGMQTTLRSSADLSRQRSEAVRIAQAEMERLRSFTALRASDAAPGQLSFEAIVPEAAASVAAANANTTFLRETIVPAIAASEPFAHQVGVRVTWTDRNALPQSVELASMIAGVPPEVAALPSLRTDRSPAQQPYGRHRAVPAAAVNNPDGVTSTFTPPGQPANSWLFSNATGLITRVCTPTCVDGNRWLLSGVVSFATGDVPDAPEAETPSDPVIAGLTISVDVLVPAAAPDEVCAVETLGTDRLRYFCAVPTEQQFTGGQNIWSGRVLFDGLPKSSSLADVTASNHKICRYTPDEAQITALDYTPTNRTLADYNNRNPYTFLRVNGPLVNKNFLVISAGNNTIDYQCPGEGPSPLIDSKTWPHDPIT